MSLTLFSRVRCADARFVARLQRSEVAHILPLALCQVAMF